MIFLASLMFTLTIKLFHVTLEIERNGGLVVMMNGIVLSQSLQKSGNHGDICEVFKEMMIFIAMGLMQKKTVLR